MAKTGTKSTFLTADLRTGPQTEYLPIVNFVKNGPTFRRVYFFQQKKNKTEDYPYTWLNQSKLQTKNASHVSCVSSLRACPNYIL
jgi:hypothetical protein